jgi:2-pyrone-4,6-dicarboxylate lactonase
MPDYLPFDPEPRKPSKKPPPLACDSQFHVFGPPGATRWSRDRLRDADATIERALYMHSVLGIQRGVIVQATTYGAGAENLLDGLALAGPGYRACAHASVLKERDDAYIAKLHDAGVRGVRFTRAGLASSLDADDRSRALARAQELGWYVKVQPEVSGIAETIRPFRHLDMPVVIDHMGRPDPEAGDADPSLRCVLDMLADGNTWVMLSLGEKISKTGAPGMTRWAWRSGWCRPHRSAASGAATGRIRYRQAAAQRCGPAGTAVPVCTRRGHAAPGTGG